ncbi:MAG: pantetheine-phosphate adenylyltransferase [Pirellulales bacterium]|nr:pantetheine-phosphate adenylyltransferase [Pirellulales bacterium]
MADEPSPRIAVYTGSFDPITLGHVNVIERASKLVDKLFVGVGINPEKRSLFNIDERIALVTQSVAHLDNVVVESFGGLAVEFVRQSNARVIIRGVRSLSDMEAEFTMALANRKLDPRVETVFLMAHEEYSHVSSTLIKQIAAMGGQEQLEGFVTPAVAQAMREKLAAS